MDKTHPVDRVILSEILPRRGAENAESSPPVDNLRVKPELRTNPSAGPASAARSASDGEQGRSGGGASTLQISNHWKE
jgi:hypothetical protein